MQKSRYAIVGFAVVVILGGLLAYCGFPVQKTDVSQPLGQVPVETKTDDANSAAEPSVTQPEVKAEAVTEKTPESEIASTTETITTEVIVPVFDLVRVEPNGAVVIAGKATPNADVDVISGSRVLGSVKATDNGDFVIAFDDVLKPGNHSLVLRATGADNKVATSAQTAIVSIPDNENGQVLALVEEPGQASRLITKPEGQADSSTTSEDRPVVNNAVDNKTDVTAAAEHLIVVEAVEIEGGKVFIAGQAKTDHTVIVYANEKMLGRSPVSPEGRFLVESHQVLAVGDYIIRADLLNKNQQVVASARVPFRREAGDNISAIAPALKEQQNPISLDDAKLAKRLDNSSSDMHAHQHEAGPALENVEGSVIIRKGDNLWTISKRTYGQGTRYTTIYLANRDQIRNPDLIWPGQVLNMPSEPLSDRDAANALRDSHKKD